jgi:transposase-like protein
MYLFRAVDSGGQTVDFYLSETLDREAAKLFLKRALANPDNRPPEFLHGMDCAATRLPSANCRRKVACTAAADNTHDATVITVTESDRVPSSDACERCKDH